MGEYKLNEDKSIASLLYICHHLGGEWDKYSLLKILYFAECKHLLKYGRPITGDRIVAMKHGPVPSLAFDKVKQSPSTRKIFSITDNVITAKITPDMDILSESDVECLNESITENCGLSFGALKKKSHNESYEKAVEKGGLNSDISYLSIAKAFGAEQEMMNYISDKISINNWL